MCIYPKAIGYKGPRVHEICSVLGVFTRSFDGESYWLVGLSCMFSPLAVGGPLVCNMDSGALKLLMPKDRSPPFFLSTRPVRSLGFVRLLGL